MKKKGTMRQDQIYTEPDTMEIMNTKQPNTISIGGVEIPSWNFVWNEKMHFQRKLDRLRIAVLLQCAALILIGILQLLR